jgi:hypothetical protein
MPKRAQFIRSHLPQVAADRSPVRSRLGAECDPSFASHASPTNLLPGRESALGSFMGRKFRSRGARQL